MTATFKQAFLAGLVCLAFAPATATAQTKITKNHPMTWMETPACQASIRFWPSEWEDNRCTRVSISTATDSHNINFLDTQNREIVYITGINTPNEVHAVAFMGKGQTMIVPATGKCEVRPGNVVACWASLKVTGEKAAVASTAIFAGGFRELYAVLR